MNLYDEFFAIVRCFNRARVPYAVIGGISLAFHDRPRFTRDIDLLILPTGFIRAQKLLSGLGYRASAPPWSTKSGKLTLHRFIKAEKDDHILVDLLVAQSKADQSVIANAIRARSSSGTVRVARKQDLIRLKRRRKSKQDLADIDALRHD